MHEFLTFITTGTIESFEDKPKEKVIYLLTILYYTIATMFAVAIIYELALYLRWETVEATIIGRINELYDRNALILLLIHLLILPVLTGFAFWFCMSSFNYERICISVSLIISTILYFIIVPQHILPKIGSIGKLDFTPYLAFLISTCVIYLITTNIFTKELIKKSREIWNKNVQIITYIYVFLFIIYMVKIVSSDWMNIIACVLMSAFLGLMLIYVRRLLGFAYAIVLHYIVTIPFIGVLIYMIINN